MPAIRASRARSGARFAFPHVPHPAMRWVWFWRWVGISLLAALWPGFMLALVALDDAAVLVVALPFLAGLIVVAIGWGFVWSQLALRAYRFEVREEDVVVQRGVVFRTRTLIPLRRVQDILVRSGPLLRLWGLSSVKLQTAGAGYHRPTWGEGQLPGLVNGDEVAAALLERVKELRGDV